MKSKFFIVLYIAIILFALLLLVSTSKSDDRFIDNLAEITFIKSRNLLVNHNFENDLNDWFHTDNIDVLETNNFKCICIQGDDKSRKSFGQNVNVVSGKTYKISFRLYGPRSGAYVLTNGKTQLLCYGNNKFKLYENEFKSNNNNVKLLFSTNKKGNYIFSDIKFYETRVYLIVIYRIISITIILFLFLYFYIIRTNFTFTIIILFILVFPILKISKEKKSIIENRNLAKYRSFINKGKNNKLVAFNLNYGNDFNEWLNDHFQFREYLIKYNSHWKMMLNNRFENNFILSGKDYFYFKRSNIFDILNLRNITEEEYKKTFLSLKRFSNFCNQKNIDLYIIIIPFGAEVYKEKLIGVNINNFAGCYSNVINKLNNDLNIHIIYAYDYLLKGKNEGLIYYKTDHHWTFLGGYIGYQLVINEIKNKYKDLYVSLENNYFISYKNKSEKDSFFDRLNIDKNNFKAYPTNDIYKIFTYKNKNSISGKWQDISKPTIIHNSIGYKKKIFLFGDSFICYYYPFFIHSFSETYLYYKSLQINMPDVEKLINNYMPDIVVLNIYAENICRIKRWYK